MRKLTCAALVSLMALAGCVTPAPSEDAFVQDGREIAIAQCARCHAVGEYGDSPMREAVPLRTVLSQYNPATLEEELINGIRVNHSMPGFQFNPQGADALIAYLRTIQIAPEGEGGA